MEGDTQSEEKAAAVLEELHQLSAKVFFNKTLTASDTSGSGRVVIPKAIAEQYFPHIEEAKGITVSAHDTHGKVYQFKWRYWVNNQSRMYLLEGASQLHTAYTMAVGDIMVFAQRPDKSLLVAGRPPTRADAVRRAPAKRGASEPKSAPPAAPPSNAKKVPQGQATA
ncbi:MAG: hypothetical protein WDW38_004601 [Sanguina aurantia]